MRRGKLHHARTAFIEKLSHFAILLGWWLVVAAVVIAAMAFVLVWG